MKRYHIICFDFDGVIGRTMEDNYRAWRRAFQPYHIALGQVEYFLLEGLNVQGVAHAVLKKHGLDPSLASPIVKAKEKFYREDNSFAFYDGVEELISRLTGNFLLALVSGASSTRLRATVREDFLQQFQVIITGDAVTRHKPDPEPYLAVARELATPPAACLVVENAPLGIRAAKEAGMDCVAVTTTLEREYLTQADLIIDKITDLQEILGLEGFPGVF